MEADYLQSTKLKFGGLSVLAVLLACSLGITVGARVAGTDEFGTNVLESAGLALPCLPIIVFGVGFALRRRRWLLQFTAAAVWLCSLALPLNWFDLAVTLQWTNACPSRYDNYTITQRQTCGYAVYAVFYGGVCVVGDAETGAGCRCGERAVGDCGRGLQRLCHVRSGILFGLR